MSSRFLSMRQGEMAVRDYVLMDRYLESCIITHPMEMYTHINVFVDGLWEGQIRLSLGRVEPAALEESFSIALCRDFRVMKDRTKPSVFTIVQPSSQKYMDINAIESSGTDDVLFPILVMLAPSVKKYSFVV